MTVIVSAVNLTSLGWITGQSVGIKVAAKSVARPNEAMAAAQQMHSPCGIASHVRKFPFSAVVNKHCLIYMKIDI